MRRAMTCLAAVAALLSTATLSTANAATGAKVLGEAEIDTSIPGAVFEIFVHAQANSGVVWISHHDDTQVGWMVARVDCVRVADSLGIVTGVVSDAAAFAPAGPGDRVALTVRDRASGDTVSFAAKESAQRCRRSPAPEGGISRGDFRVSR